MGRGLGRPGLRREENGWGSCRTLAPVPAGCHSAPIQGPEALRWSALVPGVRVTDGLPCYPTPERMALGRACQSKSTQGEEIRRESTGLTP